MADSWDFIWLLCEFQHCHPTTFRLTRSYGAAGTGSSQERPHHPLTNTRSHYFIFKQHVYTFGCGASHHPLFCSTMNSSNSSNSRITLSIWNSNGDKLFTSCLEGKHSITELFQDPVLLGHKFICFNDLYSTYKWSYPVKVFYYRFFSCH